ncbi:hypothetical protein MKQ70_33050 [Chitinophaga sedimenti]|uniref:hypothetical protein n=1 Tax=Chitinophaga sedimenti TaxID=2033606 RepID=UPI002004D4DF|nr:hypothetical protein [Chitinophaga sedimenti]MCK7559537.1 hypothetical protein [Chitinophaga sedimenti]
MHQIKKRIIYALCCLFIGGSLSAQDKTNYFVYIQNEKSQPFYLKYKGQVLSSSPKGYIILPKMEQGDAVPVTVGFPKNEYPEQSFLIKVNRRDQGLLLKNTGEEGFALYDLQTFNITKAGEGLMAKEKDPVAAEVAAGNAEALQGAGAGDTTAAEVVQAPVAEEPKKAEAPTPPKPKGAFAAALDRVVVDGRDDKIPEEKPEMVVAPVKEAPVLAPTEKLTKKQQRKAKRKAASLSDEEQEILTAVLDDERKQVETEAAEGVVADEKKAAAEEVVVEEVAGCLKSGQPLKKKRKQKRNPTRIRSL